MPRQTMFYMEINYLISIKGPYLNTYVDFIWNWSIGLGGEVVSRRMWTEGQTTMPADAKRRVITSCSGGLKEVIELIICNNNTYITHVLLHFETIGSYMQHWYILNVNGFPRNKSTNVIYNGITHLRYEYLNRVNETLASSSFVLTLSNMQQICSRRLWKCLLMYMENLYNCRYNYYK